MTQTQRFSAFLTGSAVIAAALASHPAQAQTPRWRVTPLARLDFSANADGEGTIGINGEGQVVYGYKDSSGNTHAWLWLPAADYGLAAGFHDLSSLSSSTADNSLAIARDINETGTIVGQSGAIVDAAGRAGVWTISGGTVTHTQLGTLAGSFPWSSAHAVNDLSPSPVIVGDSSLFDDCDCPPDEIGEDVFRGFSVAGTGGTMVGLAPSPDSMGSARDVNTPQGSDPLRIAGHTDCSDGGGEGAGCRFVDQCRAPKDAALWQPSTRAALTDISVNGSEGRGINNAANIVGWGFTNDTPCVRRALYWSSPTATPVNLGNTMPSGQSGDASRAEALNNLSLAQVIGWNVEADLALLWEQPSAGNWAVVDLNSTTAIGGCNSRWSLFESHDLNNSQWIVVLGTDLVGTTGTHAILLTPFPTGCIADLDADGCVEIDDLLVVISASGACPVGSFCHADITGDCGVDINDILAVNAVYCADPCPNPVPTCCQTCPQCSGGFAGGGSGPDGPLSTEEIIAAILGAPISEEMQAYLIEQLLSL